VAVGPAARQGKEHVGGEEVAIDDAQRALRELGPQGLGERPFARRVGPEGRGGEQVRAQGGEHDEADLRIGRVVPPAPGQTEVRAVLRGVPDAQRRAIDAVEGQAPPSVPASARVGPVLGAGIEQGGQGLLTQPGPRLGDGAGGGRWSPARRQRQIEAIGDLRDGAVAEQGHTQDQPDHLLRGQSPAAQRGGAGGLEGLADPLGIDVPAEVVEGLGSGDVRDLGQGFAQLHGQFLPRARRRAAGSGDPGGWRKGVDRAGS